MNHYETVFIATPVLSDVQMKEAVSKFRGVITENTIGANGCNYQVMEFTGEGNLVEKLETQYRRDERVIRFLTFKMDKYAVEYAEKRRNKNNAKQE